LGLGAGDIVDVGKYARAAYVLLSRLGEDFYDTENVPPELIRRVYNNESNSYDIYYPENASPELTDIVYDSENDSFDFYFSYMLGGIFILSDESQTKISVKNGYIYHADIYLGHFVAGPEQKELMSAVSALELFSFDAEEDFDLFDIRLAISGDKIKKDGFAYPKWVITKEGREAQ